VWKRSQNQQGSWVEGSCLVGRCCRRRDGVSHRALEEKGE